MTSSRAGCCSTWPKPCSYHEGWEDGYEAATRRPTYKPGWHTTHACISCSLDGVTPGPGCINCRNMGYDQTPCPSCPALTTSVHSPVDTDDDSETS